MLILTSLAVHMPIQRHMYISTPLHEEANIHFFGYWMKCILVPVIWGASFFLDIYFIDLNQCYKLLIINNIITISVF